MWGDLLYVIVNSSTKHDIYQIYLNLLSQNYFQVQILPDFFSYHGHRQTDTHAQTNAGKNIFPRFRGDNYKKQVYSS